MKPRPFIYHPGTLVICSLLGVGLSFISLNWMAIAGWLAAFFASLCAVEKKGKTDG